MLNVQSQRRACEYFTGLSMQTRAATIHTKAEPRFDSVTRKHADK